MTDRLRDDVGRVWLVDESDQAALAQEGGIVSRQVRLTGPVEPSDGAAMVYVQSVGAFAGDDPGTGRVRVVPGRPGTVYTLARAKQVRSALLVLGHTGVEVRVVVDG
jgi:predicted deacylase